MSRPLTPATARDVSNVLDALEHLRAARRLLSAADCPAALPKVASAIKSTEGALRHVQRRYRASFTLPQVDGDGFLVIDDATATRDHYATTGESLKRAAPAAR